MKANEGHEGLRGGSIGPLYNAGHPCLVVGMNRHCFLTSPHHLVECSLLQLCGIMLVGQQ